MMEGGTERGMGQGREGRPGQWEAKRRKEGNETCKWLWHFPPPKPHCRLQPGSLQYEDCLGFDSECLCSTRSHRQDGQCVCSCQKLAPCYINQYSHPGVQSEGALELLTSGAFKYVGNSEAPGWPELQVPLWSWRTSKRMVLPTGVQELQEAKSREPSLPSSGLSSQADGQGLLLQGWESRRRSVAQAQWDNRRWHQKAELPALARTFCSSFTSFPPPLAGGGRNGQWERRGVTAGGETLSPSRTRRKGVSFPRLAATGHHKPGSLNQIYSLTVLETRSSKSRHQLTNVPLRALGKSTLLANPSSAGSRSPWAYGPTTLALFPSSHGSPPCASHVPLPGSYRDICHWI